MKLNITSYKVTEKNEKMEILLFIDIQDSEFAQELLERKNCDTNEVESEIKSYVNKNIPSVKNAVAKVMSGAVIVCSVGIGNAEEAVAKSEVPDNIIEQAIESSPVVKVWVNDKVVNFTQNPILINDTTYIAIRELCENLGAELSWESSNKTVEVTLDGKKVTFEIGSETAIIDGQEVMMPKSIMVHDRAMVPVRFISEGLGLNVKWDEEAQIIHISSTEFIELDKKMPYEASVEGLQAATVATSGYSEEDLYWLSRLVHAESQDESFEGKLGVANIILNRTKSENFPNTIKEVIFDDNFGVQFPVTISGTIYDEPNQDSIDAAKAALTGKNNVGDSLYFINPQKALSNWIKQNRKYAFSIGNHNFYY